VGTKKLSERAETEFNWKEVTKTEISDSDEMMEQETFIDLVNHLNASPPRRATRVKLKLSVLLHGKGILKRVTLLSLSSRALAIDKKIPIRHGDLCYITMQTDPPITLKCHPIIGSVEFGMGSWDRLRILTEFSFEKILRLLYHASVRETNLRK
jgi:hypothetical protein